MTDQYDGPAMAQQILRLQAECGALKAERDALREAVAAEREACARVCEGHYDTAKAARAIRARGET
jgi:hypothetical protein